jgi:hypothetical protein
MEHNSSRVAQSAKKSPSLFETLQIISFQYHLPASGFLRPIIHIHTLNSYYFKIHISIILPSMSMFLNQSLPFRFSDLILSVFVLSPTRHDHLILSVFVLSPTGHDHLILSVFVLSPTRHDHLILSVFFLSPTRHDHLILSVFFLSPTRHDHLIFFLFCFRNNIWNVSH